MKAGGIFMASGIIDTRRDEVIDTVQAAGLTIQQVKRKKMAGCVLCAPALPPEARGEKGGAACRTVIFRKSLPRAWHG